MRCQACGCMLSHKSVQACGTVKELAYAHEHCEAEGRVLPGAVDRPRDCSCEAAASALHKVQRVQQCRPLPFESQTVRAEQAVQAPGMKCVHARGSSTTTSSAQLSRQDRAAHRLTYLADRPTTQACIAHCCTHVRQSLGQPEAERGAHQYCGWATLRGRAPAAR